MARRYFGTDGVRGVVGEDLTPDLVERLGKAATLWSEGGRVFVGRDTRGSGPELEEAFTRGVVSAGGNAVVAGVLPTPAVALLTLDLGAVISASHNPPEYNGVKLFDREGHKLSDDAEEKVEQLLDAPAPGGGSVDHVGVATDSYLEHILERATREGAAKQQSRREAVACHVALQVDDVARLLGAEQAALAAQCLEHVAVADVGGDHSYAVLLREAVEAEVRHHGDRHELDVEVEHQDRQDLVAVDDVAARVDCEHPVAVAVERDPKVVLPVANRPLQQR